MNIVKSSSEIGEIFGRGRRVNTPDVSFIIARNENQHDPCGRVAFIAGKKLGGAVWRNRAKRRMRGLCQALEGPFAGYDVLFVARKSVSTADFSKMERNARRALADCKVIKN